MAKTKKLISIVLAVALMLTSVFVGGITAAANLDGLYLTVNNYDNVPEGYEFSEVAADNYAATNLVINGSPEMEDSTNLRHFSAYGTVVASLPTELGTGNAVHFTNASSGAKSDPYQAIARIYKDNHSSLGHFAPTAGTTYEVKLKYFAQQTPSKEIQLQLRTALYSQCSYQYPNDDDGVWMEPVVIASITEATVGWNEAVAYFTAPDPTHYINLSLSSATDGSASNVDVWVDDITVAECVKMTVHNYAPDTKKSIPVSSVTTIADIQPEDIEGYRFGGVFSDEALENRLNSDALAGSYTELYFSWLPITINDFYCGFEDYSQPTKDTAFNSATSQITTDEAYVGRYSMKNVLGQGGITAFEIKNANSFNVVKGRTYTLSFAYKSDADVEIYAGLGKLGNLPSTAKAVNGTEAALAAEWKTVTLSVTADKGTSENYVLALMLYAENGATVYVDDILLSGVLESYVNPTLNTGFSSSWYPNLALFEGVELPVVWGGKSDISAPKDSNNDGVWEITNGAELAYVVQNGGTMGETTGCSFIITKDIYLNNINAVNWETGETKVDSYTPNDWFKTVSWSWGVGIPCSSNFQGSIDGGGHTIYGLYFSTPSTDISSDASYATGLIPSIIGDSTIKNLTLSHTFVKSCYNGGALVGAQTSGATVNIDRCYATNSVYVQGINAGVFCGKVNTDTKLYLTNSGSLATTKNRTDTTGDCGLAVGQYNSFTSISNCFNANGPLSSYTSENWNTVYKFNNCYQTEESGKGGTQSVYNVTTLADVSNMQGLDVFENESKMPSLNTSSAFVATEGYPQVVFTQGVALPIWGGKSDLSEPHDSDSDSILEITNGAELAYAISNGGGAGLKYILTNDIYLNDVSKINWATGEVTDGYTVNSWYYNNVFQGSIDGAGHTVYGLYYNDTSAMSWSIAGVGLVSRVAFGTTVELKNLAVDNAYVYGHSGASAFVGCGGTDNSSAETRAEIIMDRCVVGANVTILGTSAGAFRGITRGANIVVTNSYSLATVTGSTYGLLAGEAWESTVVMTNCFNANGPFGSASSGTFTNCYQTEAGANASGVIDAENMKGTDVFTDASKMPNLNAENAFTATEDFPLVSVFVKDAATDEEGGEDEDTEIAIWDGTVATEFAGGDGTQINPYQIENGAQLAYAIQTGGQVSTDGVYTDEANYNKYYIITKDIYLNDISKINWITGGVSAGYTVNSWLKHENFAGNIDGNGHTVYGLYYKDGASSYTSYPWGMGLVPYVVNGNTVTIENLGIDNCFINYECGAAAFVGTVNGSSKAYINTCFVGSNVTIKGADAGAFRGYSQGGTTSITNSYSLATTVGDKNSNGLVGIIYGAVNVSYCYNANGIIPAGSDVTAINCYQSEGTDSTGITTVSKENMKGDDVLTNKDKMPQLSFASAYVPAYNDFKNHDYYIYLPAGTMLTEDFEPTFSDSFLTSVDKEKIMDKNTMKRGAYVKFNKEPTANNILVPNALASFVRQGSYEAITSDPICDEYYGIDVQVASKQLAEQPDDTLNYLFITDIHFMNYDLSWDKQGNVLLEQARLITEWANNDDSIDFIVIGGDSVQGFWDSKDGWKSAITKIMEPFTACEKPVLVLMGNHDDNAYATWNVNYSEKIISDLDWRNYVLDPVSPANIVRPANDPNAKHYYYDFTKNGKTTRLFFLDSIDYYQEYDENGNITALEIRTALGYTEESAEDYSKYYNGRSYLGYSEEQVKWLADSLARTDEFDDAMIFSHMGTDAQTSKTDFGAEIVEVMAAYNNKTAYKNDAMNIDVSYDDDGKILSYQFGHIHKEVGVYNAAADLWQIGSSTARADQAAADAGRTIGTSTEACFDLMSVSKEAIRKYNIGGGDSGMLVNKSSSLSGDVNLDNTVDIRDLVALATTTAGTSTVADVNRDNIIGFKADAAELRKRIIVAE